LVCATSSSVGPLVARCSLLVACCLLRLLSHQRLSLCVCENSRLQKDNRLQLALANQTQAPTVSVLLDCSSKGSSKGSCSPASTLGLRRLGCKCAKLQRNEPIPCLQIITNVRPFALGRPGVSCAAHLAPSVFWPLLILRPEKQEKLVNLPLFPNAPMPKCCQTGQILQHRSIAALQYCSSQLACNQSSG